MEAFTDESGRDDRASRRAAQKPILWCETANTERFGEIRSGIVVNGADALLDLAALLQINHGG
jgi:hypothetical protein